MVTLVNNSSIYSKHRKTLKTELSFKISFWLQEMKRKCSRRDVPDVTIQREEENYNLIVITEEINV